MRESQRAHGGFFRVCRMVYRPSRNRPAKPLDNKISSVGFATRGHCAGEDQEQFSRQGGREAGRQGDR
jgi:hypothetical protein